MLDSDRHLEKMYEIGTKAAKHIAKLLELTPEESKMLFGSGLKEQDKLNEEGILRLSHFLNMWEDISTILGSSEQGIIWFKSPNTEFTGQSALEVMLSGEISDIIKVRDYLKNKVVR